MSAIVAPLKDDFGSVNYKPLKAADPDDFEGDDLDSKGSDPNIYPFSTKRKERLFLVLMLTLMSFVGLGPYFTYDSVGALSEDLSKAYNISPDGIGLLFSFYSAPNVIMAAFAGFFVDQYGTTKTTLVFSTFFMAGSLLFAFGKTLPILLASRFLIGFGSESLFVARDTLLTKWFRHRAINFGFAFVTAVGESGSSIGYLLLPEVAQRYGIEWGKWTIVFFNVACLFFTILLLVLDERYSKVCRVEVEKEGHIRFKDLRQLSLGFWYSAGIVFFTCSTLYSFFAFGSLFLQMTYRFSVVRAGRYMSLFAVGQIFAPLFGFIVDRFPRWSYPVILVGCSGYVGTQLAFAFSNIEPLWIMTAMVGFYAMTEPTIWAAISDLVDERLTGTAFGVVTMLYNFGLLMGPFGVGELVERSGSYFYVLIVMSALFGIGTIFAILLNFSPRKLRPESGFVSLP